MDVSMSACMAAIGGCWGGVCEREGGCGVWGRGGFIEARAAAGWACKAQGREKGGHHHRFPKKGGR
jgi:hypothetical protein